jgi:hypothetical protein
MNPQHEREAVLALADWASDWSESPAFAEHPHVVAVTDQYAAALLESWTESGMTESERITFGLGVLAAARWVHNQLIEWNIHDEDGPAFLCESVGVISATVARKATGG